MNRVYPSPSFTPVQSSCQSCPTIGRLAPSPTGNLHLGNAWSFLIAWLACRLESGTILLRMEDIDTQRSKKEYADAIIKDLSWLGMDWDGDIIWQSERDTLYESVMQHLDSRIYKCYCTRKELRDLAGAPQQYGQNHGQGKGQNHGRHHEQSHGQYKTHDDMQNMGQVYGENNGENSEKNHTTRFIMPDAGAPYTGTCRNLTAQSREGREQNKTNFCLRLACPPFSASEKQYLTFNPSHTLWQTPMPAKNRRVPSPSKNEAHKVLSHLEKHNEDLSISQANYTFNDLVLGEQKFSLTDCGGDFALRRSDNVWAYQLAVSSDDMSMGINQIVRGDDILTSSPRQLYIYSLFGYPAPQFAHIPLLLDEKGERLAKRHASMSLKYMREQNTSPTKIISYLASLMGINGAFNNAKELLECLQNKDMAKFPWENLHKYQNTQGIITSLDF